jgi:hypothetical protein
MNEYIAFEIEENDPTILQRLETRIGPGSCLRVDTCSIEEAKKEIKQLPTKGFIVVKMDGYETTIRAEQPVDYNKIDVILLNKIRKHKLKLIEKIT